MIIKELQAKLVDAEENKMAVEDTGARVERKIRIITNRADEVD